MVHQFHFFFSNYHFGRLGSKMDVCFGRIVIDISRLNLFRDIALDMDGTFYFRYVCNACIMRIYEVTISNARSILSCFFGKKMLIFITCNIRDLGL